VTGPICVGSSGSPSRDEPCHPRTSPDIRPSVYQRVSPACVVSGLPARSVKFDRCSLHQSEQDGQNCAQIAISGSDRGSCAALSGGSPPARDRTLRSTRCDDPLVTGVSNGSKIALSCSGLPALHPYLVVGASLLLAIDPAAKPLLTGQIVSLGALNAWLAALREIDLASEAFPISSLSGSLNLDWTVSTFQPLDPKASCPPTQEEFNSGLIGCAVAMIDLTTFKPVAAGSAVFEYSGCPLLPPSPTLVLSASTTVPHQTISASDAPGATNYWWASTLAALQAGLGGVTR